MNTKFTQRVAIISCLWGLFACGASVSAEMIVISATRTISGSGTQLESLDDFSTKTGTFSNDLLNSGYVRDDSNSIVGSVSASASQSSTMSKLQIRGLGRGSGFGSGPADGTGMADMKVNFRLEESTTLTLSGQLRLAPHGLGLNGSEAYVKLVGPGGDAFEIMMNDANQPDATGIIDFTGTGRLTADFPAGDYTLEAMAMGHGSDGLTRCADFDFTLTAAEVAVVPEPSAATIFCLAFAGLHFLRRRK